MIKLTYRPSGTPTGHLALVGKGIMYDSGGISLKPGDEVHAPMKNDMSGRPRCWPRCRRSASSAARPRSPAT